jgi:hypothetical protein
LAHLKLPPLQATFGLKTLPSFAVLLLSPIGFFMIEDYSIIIRECLFR